KPWRSSIPPGSEHPGEAVALLDPPRLGAPRRSRGAPRSPQARSTPAKPWRSSIPPGSEHPGEAVALLDPPHARSTPAKPWRSSIPPTLGAPRRSRGTPRYPDRFLVGGGPDDPLRGLLGTDCAGKSPRSDRGFFTSRSGKPPERHYDR